MADLVKPGVVAAILSDEEPVNPVFQVLGAKIIDSSATERVRLNLSDGEYSLATTMLATQLNHLVKEKKIDKYAVIQVKKYQVSVLQQSRHILVCLEVDILKTAEEVGEKIGDPISSNQFVKGSSRPKPALGASTTSGISKPGAASKSTFDSPKPSAKFPFTKGNTPNTPGGTPMRVLPIASLTPYQNKWTIKARVSQKGNIKEWKNARGEGKLFSFTVLDESGDIRITGFKEDVDKFYDLIEQGKVYYIANATLKPANRQYNNTSHDYEMTLRRETSITPCIDEDVSDVPKVIYNFVGVSKLSEHISKIVDVIAVVKSCDDVQEIMIRSQNRETKRRNIDIVDSSGAEVRVTLWGDDADKFDGSGNPVIAFKSVRVSDFGGCSLSTIGSSMIARNPDIPEAFELKQWYETGGCNQSTQSLTTGGSGSATTNWKTLDDIGDENLGMDAKAEYVTSKSTTNWKTLGDIKEENLGMDDKAEYITAKCTILYCKKENVLYQACATKDCNKKVVDLQNGTYRCEKCNKEMNEFKYRMILNMNVADDTDNMWVTCFQEQGELLLGVSTEELGRLKEQDEAAFEEAIKKAQFQTYFLKLRVKMEKFNEEERLRCSVVNVSPMSYEEYGKKLIADIQKLSMK